jgi:hypothetical protein
MVPPAFVESRTLAFAGAYRSPSTTIIAQVQALWITAFMGSHIPSLSDVHMHVDDTISPVLSKRPSETLTVDLSDPSSRILYETALHTQFGKWRYSRGFGARFPELWYDGLPYVDLLLRDVGVENRRKGNWFTERFTPYWPKDYKGIISEFLERRATQQSDYPAKDIEVRSRESIIAS